MNNKKHFEYSFLLISHYATYAMQDLIYEYLTNNKSKFVKKINFPLPELPFLKKIDVEENKLGKLVHTSHIFSFVQPASFAYLIHAIQLFFLVVVDERTYDVAIPENSLLTLVCLLLKSIGKIKKVIFYSHGLANDRFNKSLLNKIYGWMDNYAARHSDSNWLLNKKMIIVRKEQGVRSDSIFWVPTALQISKIKRNKKFAKKSLFFLGTFNEMNGILLLPHILKEVKKKYPTYTMDIIGDGPLKEELIKEFKKEKLYDSVTLLGLQRFDEYRSTMTDYAIGLAPYRPSQDNLLNSTDPMKLRLYMAAGLPIITTKGFPFSKEVVENNLGFAVEYSSKAFALACLSLLKDTRKNIKIRENNLQYSLQFDQENIFRKPLEELLYE